MIRLLYQKVLKHAGLPHVRFVDLRHTYVVLALRSGKEVKEISAEFGHTRVTETRKRYKAYFAPDKPKQPPCGAVCGGNGKTKEDSGCTRKYADVLACKGGETTKT